MTDSRVSTHVGRGLALRLDRRRLLGCGAALGLIGSGLADGLTASAAPISRPSASPRLQTDASTLVIADNLSSGGLWLTIDPGRFYEPNPGALMNVVYEPLLPHPRHNPARQDRAAPCVGPPRDLA